MPMPETVTQEDLDRWGLSWLEYRRDNPAGRLGRLLRGGPPDPRRVWYPGCWLHEQLLARGCPAELADDICFANGQRTAAREHEGADPWAIAQESLEAYGREEWDRPGMTLARQLLARHGLPPDLAARVAAAPEAELRRLIPELRAELRRLDPRRRKRR
jgi:hypothetical protein